MQKKHILFITLGINLVIFVLGYVFLTHVDVDWMRDWISSFGYFAPVIYVLTYVLFFVVPFNPIPKSVLTYFALLSFGPFNALILSLASDFVSITINYFLFRNFDTLLSLKKRQMLNAFATKNGWKALLAARLFPITNGYTGADFPSYAAGVVRMSYTTFILVSMVPWILIDIVYFYGIEALLRTNYVIPVFVAFILFSFGYTLYRYRNNKSV